MHRPWLLGEELSPHDEFRLFCLPYAGGNAAAYLGLRDVSGPHLTVCPIELPGRGARRAEAPFTSMTPLVRYLADALEADLDRPYALFGYSLGGLVAFELARALRERGVPQPARLFVSAIAAPGSPPIRPPIHGASDEELRAELRAVGGTPRELLDSDEFMALALPVLRADYSVLETYEYREKAPLALPITVFGGRSDQVAPPPVLSGWRTTSAREVRLQLFAGDHFFLHSATAEVKRAVERSLGLGETVGHGSRPAAGAGG